MVIINIEYVSKVVLKKYFIIRQCSECDNSNSNSEPETVDPNAPRRLRYGGRERSISDSHRSSSIVNDVSIKYLNRF